MPPEPTVVRDVCYRKFIASHIVGSIQPDFEYSYSALRFRQGACLRFGIGGLPNPFEKAVRTRAQGLRRERKAPQGRARAAGER
jgi:hypothetical protein